jgi:hypothetical protein
LSTVVCEIVVVVTLVCHLPTPRPEKRARPLASVTAHAFAVPLDTTTDDRAGVRSRLSTTTTAEKPGRFPAEAGHEDAGTMGSGRLEMIEGMAGVATAPASKVVGSADPDDDELVELVEPVEPVEGLGLR